MSKSQPKNVLTTSRAPLISSMAKSIVLAVSHIHGPATIKHDTKKSTIAFKPDTHTFAEVGAKLWELRKKIPRYDQAIELLRGIDDKEGNRLLYLFFLVEFTYTFMSGKRKAELSGGAAGGNSKNAPGNLKGRPLNSLSLARRLRRSRRVRPYRIVSLA